MSLNEKQNQFAHFYLQCGGNATAAAIKAGYSPTSAAKRGCENLKHPEVMAIIDAQRSAIMDSTEVFDVVAELKSLYRRAVAGGALAVASNTLATLARVVGAEAPQKIDFKHLSDDELDRRIAHYTSVINMSKSLHSLM